EPAVTVVEQPTVAMGEAAVRILLSGSREQQSPTHVVLSSNLVLRDSHWRTQRSGPRQRNGNGNGNSSGGGGGGVASSAGPEDPRGPAGDGAVPTSRAPGAGGTVTRSGAARSALARTTRGAQPW
ncbi:MAG: hypothetical protein ACYCR4_04635, partial [Acidimicrobiales bacterium]